MQVSIATVNAGSNADLWNNNQPGEVAQLKATEVGYGIKKSDTVCFVWTPSGGQWGQLVLLAVCHYVHHHPHPHPPAPTSRPTATPTA